MSDLLPFGQAVRITHPFMEFETGWITNVAPSYFIGADWQYEIRTDYRLRSGYFLWGGEWFDEMDIKPIVNGVLPRMLNVIKPKFWPPKAEIGRRPGIWGINGAGVNQALIDQMFSWNPGAVTCFYDYIQANGIEQYKNKYPNVPVIIRFQHDKNWLEDTAQNIKNKSAEIIAKWDVIKNLGENVYCYFCNEINLHYENGDSNPNNQPFYETKEFYKTYADWITALADRIKQAVPEYPLVCPPFAYGHREDGSPDDNGIPTEDYAGYEFLVDTIKTYFNNTICGHYYWGNAGGSVRDWLYGEDSQWHAFRWQKVLSLFENYFNNPVKMIIDEAGNFAPDDDDFTDQIIYHAENTLKDKRIKALTYFLFDDPTGANDINSWQKVRNLDEHLTTLKNLPDIYVESPTEPETPTPTPDPTPQPEPSESEISMEIIYGQSNLPLIVGNYIYKDIPILVQPPYGSPYTVMSGSKTEYGEAGFEAGYANMQGDYILTIEGEEYKIPCKDDGSKIFVAFIKSDEIEESVVLQSTEISKKLADEIMEKYPDVFSIIMTKRLLSK